MLVGGERIRTSGPCLPKTVLYQAELLPDGAPVVSSHSGADRRCQAGWPIGRPSRTRQASLCGAGAISQAGACPAAIICARSTNFLARGCHRARAPCSAASMRRQSSKLTVVHATLDRKGRARPAPPVDCRAGCGMSDAISSTIWNPSGRLVPIVPVGPAPRPAGAVEPRTPTPPIRPASLAKWPSLLIIGKAGNGDAAIADATHDKPARHIDPLASPARADRPAIERGCAPA